MNARLPRFIPQASTVGLSLVVLILLGNMLVSHLNTQRLIENERGLAHTQEVLTTLEEVLTRETQAEAAERGFLITDNADYLQSYDRAVKQVGESMVRLAELTGDDSWEQQRVAGLQVQINTRMDDLHNVMSAKQAGGFDAARQTISINHGRQLMNKIRALLGEMQDHERDRLARRATASRRSASMTSVTDKVGSLLGIAMVALAFWLFRRDAAHCRQADDVARRLAAIVESSGDAIISKALDGTITSWNAGAVRIYGYTAEEAIGRPGGMLIPRERVDEDAQHMLRVGRGERIEHFVTQRVRRDGSRIDVSLTISPMRDADGNVIGVSAIARDVTGTKALQREVLAIADDEQRRIGQDLHDGTGQELTGLALFAQRLSGMLAAKNLPESELAAKIVNGLEQALGHVRALSKGLVPVEVDGEGLMVALADLVARADDLQDVRCTFECRQPVRILDNQTATHLYRMSQEAMANALKHGKPKHVAVCLHAEGDLVTLEIADDGQGLPETPRETTGMGLRIMHYRAELIGAKLEIKPNQPTGTRVVCAHNQRHPVVATELASEPAFVDAGSAPGV